MMCCWGHRGGVPGDMVYFFTSFIFILAGGPFIETTHNKVGFTAPLTAITAAVVGVILNLALFLSGIASGDHPVSTRGPQPLPRRRRAAVSL